MSSKDRGYFLIFLAGISWGTLGTGIKLLSNQGLTEMQTAFYMQLFALVLMVPVVLIKCGVKALKISWRLFVILFATGLFSEALFDLFQAMAVAELGVAVSGVMLYISPLFVMICSRIMFKEKITKIKIMAFVINLFGCFMTVTGGSLDTSIISVKGIVCGVAAAICYGIVTVSDKYTAGEADPLVITFYILLSGFISIAVISRCWTFPASVFRPINFLIGAGAGLFTTMLPYLFFAKGLACDIEASKAPIFASIEVVISAVLGVVLFRENLGIANILGIAIVVASIVLLNMGKDGKQTVNEQ